MDYLFDRDSKAKLASGCDCHEANLLTEQLNFVTVAGQFKGGGSPAPLSHREEFPLRTVTTSSNLNLTHALICASQPQKTSLKGR